MTTQRTEAAAKEVIYLLGFSPSPSTAVREKIKVELEMVESHSFRNITAWIVRVDRSQFDGPDTEHNLSDVNWLAPRVMAHETAVETLARELPFYPANFGSLFVDLPGLAKLVEQNWRTLTEFFANEARHVEWGIKCFVHWERAVSVFQQSGEANDNSKDGQGVNYLLRKQMIRKRDARVRAWLGDQLRAIESGAETLSIQVNQRSIASATSEGDWEAVLNLAALVTRQDQDKLESWIATQNDSFRSGHAVLYLQLTGPWPLYSFRPSLGDPNKDQSSAA